MTERTALATDQALVHRAIAVLEHLQNTDPTDDRRQWLIRLRTLLANDDTTTAHTAATEYLELLSRSSVGTAAGPTQLTHTELDIISNALPTAPAPRPLSVDVLTETYRVHYGTLVRLAALLLDDPDACVDVVQEAFVRVHVAMQKGEPLNPDKTLAYLRSVVVNLSRSTLRRTLMRLRLSDRLPDSDREAADPAHAIVERDALIRVLRDLPRRQREVIVLRYYADMTERQVADTLHISAKSVGNHASRGLEALRRRMEVV